MTTLLDSTPPQPQLHQWTVDDYHRMIEAGLLVGCQVELLFGEIIEMSPEGPLHTHSGEGIAQYLRQQLSGKAWIREARPITLSTSEPEPDIAVVRLPWNQYRQRHPRPADVYWLIEISDSSLYIDNGRKLQAYAQANIAEYWIVDLKHQQVSVCRQPNGNTYDSQQTLTTGKIASLAFPGLSIPVKLLLEGEF